MPSEISYPRPPLSQFASPQTTTTTSQRHRPRPAGPLGTSQSYIRKYLHTPRHTRKQRQPAATTPPTTARSIPDRPLRLVAAGTVPRMARRVLRPEKERGDSERRRTEKVSTPTWKHR